MTIEKIDAVVIGAGVVGLACARLLAMHGIQTLIIERNNGIGLETSSRNSEVIHAGIYYPPTSLKSRFCVAGNQSLYEYCAQRGIAHRRCGKLIVSIATDQESELARLLEQARSNGVNGVRMITRKEAVSLEPQLSCTAALLSESTGIIDSHALMQSLLADAESYGATLALHTEILRGEITPSGILLQVISGTEEMTLKAKIVINSAGLSAANIASNIAGLAEQHIPKIQYAKGNYFSLTGRSPFSRLIYPVPEPGGLGVHLTLDLGGQARFGPDVEWVDNIDYSMDPKRAESFYAEVRKYWTKLPDNALQPAYCGIRPKIIDKAAANADFLIEGPHSHGIPGLINLFGIESPGLTSCLPIAEYVCSLVGLSSIATIRHF